MINHDIYKHVGNDFMPPFDREDIVALAGALDEILDEIEDVLQYFYMFDIHQIPEDALRFATLIRKSCKAVDAAMEDFRNFKKSRTSSSWSFRSPTTRRRPTRCTWRSSATCT